MDVLDRVRQTEFLGRDFLVWLWFKSETIDGQFDLGDTNAEVWFDGKITLQSEHGEDIETIVCSGENAELREARFALTENKKITQALIKLIIGDDEWSFILDSTWMDFRSFKTPKVVQDKKDDPEGEGFFYEKVLLTEQAVATVDAIFLNFIKLRLSSEWKASELPALMKWISEGR